MASFNFLIGKNTFFPPPFFKILMWTTIFLFIDFHTFFATLTHTHGTLMFKKKKVCTLSQRKWEKYHQISCIQVRTAYHNSSSSFFIFFSWIWSKICILHSLLPCPFPEDEKKEFISWKKLKIIFHFILIYSTGLTPSKNSWLDFHTQCVSSYKIIKIHKKKKKV